MPPVVVWIILGTVCAAWLTLTLASVFITGVDVPEGLNGLFLAIAGAAVAKIGGDRKKTNSDHTGGEPG